MELVESERERERESKWNIRIKRDTKEHRHTGYGDVTWHQVNHSFLNCLPLHTIVQSHYLLQGKIVFFFHAMFPCCRLSLCLPVSVVSMKHPLDLPAIKAQLCRLPPQSFLFQGLTWPFEASKLCPGHATFLNERQRKLCKPRSAKISLKCSYFSWNSKQKVMCSLCVCVSLSVIVTNSSLLPLFARPSGKLFTQRQKDIFNYPQMVPWLTVTIWDGEKRETCFSAHPSLLVQSARTHSQTGPTVHATSTSLCALFNWSLMAHE